MICFSGVSTKGRKVCVADCTPSIIIIKETDDTFKVIENNFSYSEKEYIKKSNDINGFLHYLEKYLYNGDGAERMIKLEGTKADVIATKNPHYTNLLATLEEKLG